MKINSVHSLLTIDENVYDACTLCIDSVRRGFPSQTIAFDVNNTTDQVMVRLTKDILRDIPDSRLICVGHNPTPLSELGSVKHRPIVLRPGDRISGDMLSAVIKDAEAEDGQAPLVILSHLERPVHHARWIQDLVQRAARPTAIIDGDTIFWDRCDDWDFAHPLAGYYIPEIWNDYAKCRSQARVHTSFLYISDPEALRRSIRDAYPTMWESDIDEEYCPAEYFYPGVRFFRGEPNFWDTCAGLFQAVGAMKFRQEHLACYDHLNSASFYNVMLGRLDNKEGFAFMHHVLTKKENRHRLKNIWPVVEEYYTTKALQFYPNKI